MRCEVSLPMRYLPTHTPIFRNVPSYEIFITHVHWNVLKKYYELVIIHLLYYILYKYVI